ncbi:MAG TPA: beta-N-acetylglucosaminidase domain-containing protein [Acidimicrobiales bacterium]|nr:beta-N-acetylglucosaminidase domain-containing protein [Acidimicrobiales bacterium]
MTPGGPWLGAIEGYYGRPHSHAERLALVRWLGVHGYRRFVHAPKDDPFHRARWREPYPADEEARWSGLARTGASSGVDVWAAVSPGLDWAPGDEPALAAKVRRFVELGAAGVLVAWDDVPGGGAELGQVHGAAVGAAVAAAGDGVDWMVCPTDYAVEAPTPYLEALAAELPTHVPLVWTGPRIVSPTIDADVARRLVDGLGHPLVLWENFPVSDGGMRGVLHLGPAPRRDPGLVDVLDGVIANLMEHPLANRVALEVVGRWWTDPHADRDRVWAEVVGAVPGLVPLARACRSWVDDPGPDAELVAWADAAPGDDRLRRFLAAGCRDGLDRALAAELEPWLVRWEAEAAAMLAALDVLEHPAPTLHELGAMAAAWNQARRTGRQLFGIRHAFYPVAPMWGPEAQPADAVSVVSGENLTDRLCRRALAGVPTRSREP